MHVLAASASIPVSLTAFVAVHAVHTNTFTDTVGLSGDVTHLPATA
jgi:hypothetical protein